MNMPRWFEVVTRNGNPVDEPDLPDREIGKRWDHAWKKLGYKRQVVLFELIKSEPKGNGHMLTFACPGPFYIVFPRPGGKLGLDVDKVLDLAKEPTGAVKLVPDIGPGQRARMQ